MKKIIHSLHHQISLIVFQHVFPWSSKIKRSEVLKKGTNADKSKLPAMKPKNNPNANERTFSGGHARKTVQKRAKKGGKKRDVLDDVTDIFEDAFG
jgi:hypothetical protein